MEGQFGSWSHRARRLTTTPTPSQIPLTCGKELQGLAMSFRCSADDSKHYVTQLFLSPTLRPGLSVPSPRAPALPAGQQMGTHQRAGMAGPGFLGWEADASGFRFADFVGNPQCLGWQRRELTLSLDP